MAILRIALRNYSDFEQALIEESRQFESLHPGVKVELTSVGIHELHDATLTRGGLCDGRFDLALLGTDWLAEGMESGALEDLQPWHLRQPLPDWPQGWPRSLVEPLIFDSRLSSIPWHDGPECLVYRTDIFSDPARRDAFHAKFGRDLAPPTTWDEFAATARFLNDPANGMYGTVFAAFPDGHNTLYDFALQLWSRGGELLESSGQPNIATPEAAAAIDYYRNLIRDAGACHPASPQLDSTQSGDRFLAGEVAMMVNWFGFAARASRPGSPLQGKVAIAPIPTDGVHPSISLSVFWALAMGSGSHQKDLAWQFLQFAASPQRDLGIAAHGTVPVRLSSWRDPGLRSRVPVYAQVEAISLGARCLPRGPGMAQFANLIDAVVTRALGTSDPSAVILGDAQREIVSKGLKFA
jgi:multiple sugar transport system substrate-binding protein